ncbi:tRNA modification GTPase trmE [Nitrosomonas ureae]|uniref:tRNA modification GTPase MnmE n=1 Tax=Nitrosomonas ureae TaxID=44577 RepID=A0A1H2DQS8_9PROT|nr:tRNA modification GTPase trmE [Nitrosomonas ureae]
MLYFPGPHSYTGEDVLELHGHGGPAVMNLLLKSCLSAGARLAQPGEFTLRAYLNNKIDLVQAESVAAIIEASTHEAARCAVNSLQGHFSARIEALVSLLITLRMLIEATLDFPEDELDNLKTLQIREKLDHIVAQLEQTLAGARQGNLLQEGIRIVLAGAPNVGKSSLLNQLVEEDAAIVTEIPGTTRDTIQRTIILGGMPIHIVDTAGLRETGDIVEQKGIERTLAAIKRANLVLRLLDSSQHQPAAPDPIKQYIPDDKPQITVFNKIDLRNENPKIEEDEHNSSIHLSAKTGAGIELLRQKILHLAGWQFNHAGEGIFMARQRHLEALTLASAHLQNAQEYTENEYQLELIAEELRLAQTALSTITGQFTADDLLGEIFSHFCIGK